ncbi:methyltransferase [Sulfitobacter sp. F26169L]|uniref:tRNA1(Val) (adenine(37)-N6)-methyltransferase n=1 Tax=Sulfitobacter sp. F26169L TaxID=2996015 RepID=UPI002260F02E|nr:methyltransferase domain-containing protein [Sulfitobacter sp. F26169L]MCX7566941.1 methyltransferase [Sulfitobacter sp. F26169L]
MSDEELSRDAFLGGLLHLLQPQRGYRAGVDPVLLAATIPAVSGQRVLELGCGVGAAILCLGARVSGLSLTGVEREEAYAALAARNGGAALEVVTADIAAMPLTLRQRQFDHVLANPPYWRRDASIAANDPAREAALGEQTPLALWIKTGAKRLAPKGYLHVIHRAERLPDLLAALPSDMGSIEVLPIAARTGRAAERVILRARKSGRADFRLSAPLILHRGDHHQDGDQYTAPVRDALRAGAPLNF